MALFLLSYGLVCLSFMSETISLLAVACDRDDGSLGNGISLPVWFWDVEKRLLMVAESGRCKGANGG